MHLCVPLFSGTFTSLSCIESCKVSFLSCVAPFVLLSNGVVILSPSFY